MPHTHQPHADQPTDQPTDQPRVSILMPIYNAQRYLSAALESMVAQSFTDWEMICIDDGSSDGSSDILRRWALKDQRLRVISQENQGIARTLNHGLTLARAPLVARMDADDISMPERLAIQVAFLDQHADHVAVGGSILKIDDESDRLGVDHLPAEHSAIEQALLRRQTGMFHPTVLMRKRIVQAVGGYRRQHEPADDHDLWLRLAQRGRLANLQEVVLCYRLHASSLCWQRSATQRDNMNRILEEAYAARGLSMPAELVLSSDIVRSPGGPGKWARMAAKGYAPRTALKHLRKLWQEPVGNGYRMRMTLETLMRIACSLPKLPSRHLPVVPKYS
ncbi:MAG: glycosyltransferase [Pirellulaceae bacterium]|nr:glycosyltransferase [Pirellulaceae bacterium]